jgi:predicted neutral ceramidase superfamily lipid hydrolase
MKPSNLHVILMILVLILFWMFLFQESEVIRISALALLLPIELWVVWLTYKQTYSRQTGQAIRAIILLVITVNMLHSEFKFPITENMGFDILFLLDCLLLNAFALLDYRRSLRVPIK